MNKKYFFISYRWKNYNTGVTEWQFCNDVIDYSPMVWLRNRKDEYYAESTFDIVQLDFYNEINQTEYKIINGHIG